MVVLSRLEIDTFWQLLERRPLAVQQYPGDFRLDMNALAVVLQRFLATIVTDSTGRAALFPCRPTLTVDSCRFVLMKLIVNCLCVFPVRSILLIPSALLRICR